MLTFIYKFHRQLNLLLLALCGLACGHLVAVVLGISLRPPPAAKAGQAFSRPAQNMLPNRPPDPSAILQRNMFAPELRNLDRRLPRPDSAATLTPGRRADLSLYGTLVAGAASLALIKTGPDLVLYRLDQSLPDQGGRIETIDRKRVEIRNPDQTLSVLALADDPAAEAGPRPAPGYEDGIRDLGGNRWQVARTTAEQTRQNLAQQLRLAQMEPRIVNGRTDGFLIRMLNPRSILARIGLLRADVVLRVNGMPLDSPEKGLQIMQQLREARRITLDIERDQQPLTFVYEIN